MISTGPLYRLYHVIGWTFFDSEANGLRTYIFTLTCFDALGMGALLAIVSHLNYVKAKIQLFFRRFVLLPALVGIAFLYAFQKFDVDWDLYLVLSDLFFALLFCWLTSAAAAGFRGPVGSVLEYQPIRYLGKISYGIYVYHPFMPMLLAFLFARLGWAYDKFAWTSFVLATVLTVVVSSLSWYFMERPINALKRYV